MWNTAQNSVRIKEEIGIETKKYTQHGLKQYLAAFKGTFLSVKFYVRKGQAMRCYHLGGNFYFDINCAEALLISQNFC